MIQRSWQKGVDKGRLLWYTTSRKNVEKEKLMQALRMNKTLTQNQKKTESVDRKIRAIGESLATVQQKYFPNLRTPVIAGGAPRDMAYGLAPKDYDVFIDLSSFSDDEKDDVVNLLGIYTLEHLGTKEDFSFIKDIKMKKEEGKACSGKQGPFLVYGHARYGFAAQDWNALTDKINPQTVIQFIGHSSPLLGTDPLAFVNENFDWELTKCLYDPLKEEYEFSDAFNKASVERVLTFKDSRTQNRIANWKAVWAVYGYNFPFKVKDVRPKSDNTDGFFSKSRTNTLRTDYQFFQQMVNEQRAARVFPVWPLAQREADWPGANEMWNRAAQRRVAVPDDAAALADHWLRGQQWLEERGAGALARDIDNHILDNF